MIDEYLTSWNKFRACCESKAKGRAIINTDGWRKLVEFHLEQYLLRHPNPYLFLFTIKMNKQLIYRQHRMETKYRYYCRKRMELLNPLIHGTFHYHR